MRGEPSHHLVDLLTRLKLASADEVRGMAPRARRLAGELPDFESVWVDALASARILTPYQAAEINAGRGEALANGPYVVARPLSSVHYAACFEARHIENGRKVRLHVVSRPQSGAVAAAQLLAALVEQSRPLAGPAALVVEDAGLSGANVWAVCPATQGMTAADWMVENGRFPPEAVAHAASEMVSRLVELERLGIVHGDVSTAGLLLESGGRVSLPMPGVRSVVRPHEGYSFADLAPEGYDYLAPERIAEGRAPTTASDVYACGAVWWHLLTGRPPFAGGNSLAKLKAVHAARVIDVRQLAPNVPDGLARGIAACLARAPDERPQSFSDLARRLGPGDRRGAAHVSRALARQSQIWQLALGSPTRRGSRKKRLPVAGIMMAAVMLSAVGSWPLWSHRVAPRQASAVAEKAPAMSAVAKRSPTAAAATRATRDGPSVAAAPVIPATANLPAGQRESDDLVLPGDKTVPAGDLALKPGGRVRGSSGNRPLVAVGAAGLVVACEDVVFDGIDFIWDADEANARLAGGGAMIIVDAQSVEFRGCSFSTRCDVPPVAIAWSGAEEAGGGVAGEVIVGDCVFSGMDAVVDCRSMKGFSLRMTNSLCVAAGPIVRLNRVPPPEQSIAIVLERVTTRGDSSVVECRYARLEATPGAITISATDSVFDTNPQGGLLLFSGPRPPQALARAIAWSGQGSLVTPHTAVAVWHAGARKRQALAEDELEVAGLVRTAVEFAGPAEGPPAASRIKRWQGPLRSIDPPGANAGGLSLPKQ